MRKHFRHSIRFKLLLVSLTLLGIPWAGYQFIIETERFLRDAQQHNLQTAAQAMASLLARHAGEFSGSNLPGQANRKKNLYLNHWERSPVIDGYADEWPLFEGSFSRYELPGKVLTTELAIGKHRKHAYLLLRIADDTRAYGPRGDSIELAFGDGDRLQHIKINPLAPGWVVAQSLDRQTPGSDPRIRGEWQETSSGYVVELRFPARLLGTHFGISVLDSSTGNRLQTSRLGRTEHLGRLVALSPTLQTLLEELTPVATRAWILDHEGLVLARHGQLDSDAPLSADQEQLPWLIRQLILTVLPRQADSEFSLSTHHARIDISVVREALAGRPAGFRRHIPDSDAIAVSSAVPVRSDKGVIGSVLIEQTTNAILSIQNLALQRLFGVTLFFFVVTSLGLLAFASFLTTRIRRLRNSLDQAVSHDGRIIGEIAPGKSRDEIGELGQGLSAVLRRLGEYNHYLEAMASRLAHELRTPLSIVRTSLDNAAQIEDKTQQSRYLQRAHNGAERLEVILQRLREATRLEQALQHAEVESFDLVALLKNQTDAFRTIWPGEDIRLECESEPLMLNAVPDLICQALEKLVSNAVDFHEPDSPVYIQLKQTDQLIDLAVINRGPPLPQNLDLFKSMVSGRTGHSDQPHLGLGLYLVRLIAEFHHGEAYALNDDDASGVCIGFRMPIQPGIDLR